MDSVLAEIKSIAGKAIKMPEASLLNLENVGAILEEALKISDLTRLEIHGPEEELAKLRDPLANLKPEFFTLEYGFRR